jgi:hypothetical protein
VHQTSLEGNNKHGLSALSSCFAVGNEFDFHHEDCFIVSVVIFPVIFVSLHDSKMY